MKTHMSISFTFWLSYSTNEKQKLNKEHEWQEVEYTFQTTFLLNFASKNTEKQKNKTKNKDQKNPPQIKKNFVIWLKEDGGKTWKDWDDF